MEDLDLGTVSKLQISTRKPDNMWMTSSAEKVSHSMKDRVRGRHKQIQETKNEELLRLGHQ